MCLWIFKPFGAVLGLVLVRFEASAVDWQLLLYSCWELYSAAGLETFSGRPEPDEARSARIGGRPVAHHNPPAVVPLMGLRLTEPCPWANAHEAAHGPLGDLHYVISPSHFLDAIVLDFRVLSRNSRSSILGLSLTNAACQNRTNASGLTKLRASRGGSAHPKPLGKDGAPMGLPEISVMLFLHHASWPTSP